MLACAKTLAILILAGWALDAHRQVFVWQNNLSLWTHAVAVTPEKPRPWLNLGVSLVDKDRIASANAMERAVVLARQPRHGNDNELIIIEQLARVNLAYIATVNRDYPIAYALLTEARRREPENQQIRFSIALWYAMQHRCAEAQQELDAMPHGHERFVSECQESN